MKNLLLILLIFLFHSCASIIYLKDGQPNIKEKKEIKISCSQEVKYISTSQSFGSLQSF
jgi:uncharacterized protein YceK